MATLNVCARCGATLRPQQTEGLCMRCLLESGLATQFNPPDVQDSAPARRVDPLGDSGLSSPPEAEVRHFGDYELLEEIARGGMGIVYRARHASLGRIVALKMILAGPFADKQTIQRFRGEVTAAALLKHPNIVAIHDVGVHDGQHYFSMEFVEGQNLAQLVGNRPLPPTQAARYVKLIAAAIHYAHQQGILHRDLKPSNVLVDASDQPRVTDFGLAKRFGGDASLTLTGQVLGSPNFMPPEQASSQRGKVGRHSDVYGLGAILYYLLTARPPFQADSFESVINQVVNTDPVSPRLLNSSVPRDLETICVKCLQKEPARRYQTAQELADELDRFLRDEPIQARPVTRAERTWRWCRRRPAVAGLVAALVLVFTLGFAGTLWQWRHAVHSAQAEIEQRKRADQNLYDSDLSLAQHAWDAGDLGHTQVRLQAHRPRLGDTDRERRSFEWYYLWKLCEGDQRMTLSGQGQAVTCVAISPDGKRMASGSVGSPVQVWDATTGKLLETFPEDHVVSLAFSPDGRALGVGGRNQMIVWNLESRRIVCQRTEALGDFRLLFPPAGTLLIVGKNGGLRTTPGGSAEVFDYITGETNRVFPESGGHVALSPNGETLATANWGKTNTTKLWSVATGRLLGRLDTDGAIAMAFSPDSRTLATTGWKSDVALWDVARQQMTGWITNRQRNIWSLAFSPDGRSLATAGTDQTVRLHDVSTREETERLVGHGDEVLSVAFIPNGPTLASGSKDGTVRVWSRHPERPTIAVTNVTSRPVFSPDGRWVAAGIDPGGVALWEVATLQRRALFVGAFDPVAFSSDSSALITRGTNYFLKTFDVNTQTVLATVSTGPVGEVDSKAELSPDGQILAVGFTTGALLFADARTGVVITNIARACPSQIFQIAFSPNGRLLATTGREVEAGRDPGPRIWDVATHANMAVLAGHTDITLGVAFTPDGRIMASGGVDNSVKFWDTTTWEELPSSLNQMEQIAFLAFSPNGRTLATACEDGFIRFWSVATRRELAAIRTGLNVRYITFSPDGQTLAEYDWSQVLRFWRAPITDDNHF